MRNSLLYNVELENYGVLSLNKKKIIIIIVSIIAAIAVLAGLTVFLLKVFKADPKPTSTTVTVGEVSGSVGDTVTVPVKITGNPGIMGLFLEFNYDKEKLEYVNYEKGELLSDCEIADNNGTLKMVSVEDNDFDKDGTLINLKFKVKDGASGESKIELKLEENSICNYNEESISAKPVNGKITVK